MTPSLLKSLLRLLYGCQVPDESLLNQKNKQFIKVMVSACLIWDGATKLFLLMGWSEKECTDIQTRSFIYIYIYIYVFDAYTYKYIRRLYIHNNCIFVQDNALSHCSNHVQHFIQEALNSGFL